MRWLLRALIAAYFLTVPLTASAGKPIRWVPDKPWASRVAHAVRGNYTRVQIACMRPVVPKGAAATFNVVQEDCIIIANNAHALFCGEVAWQNGPLPPEPLDCTVVAKAFRDDVKPGWVLTFHFPKRAPEA